MEDGIALRTPAWKVRVRWPRRIALAAAGLWMAGLAWFLLTLSGPAESVAPTDGIVVFTGHETDRILLGYDVLEAGRAPRLLVSGVHERLDEPALRRQVSAAAAGPCCTTVGHAARDTIGNAEETADWMWRHGMASITLVTADYHMPRALWHLQRRLPLARVTALRLRTGTATRLGYGFVEYNKLIVQHVQDALGLMR